MRTNVTKKLVMVLAIAGILGFLTVPLFSAVVASADLVAYNDCVHGGSPPNTTIYSAYMGDGGGFEDTDGFLKDSVTGLFTSVWVDMTGDNISGSISAAPSAGTDAYDTFQLGVAAVGVNLGDWSTSYNNSSLDWYYQVTFTGLDPAKSYEFATTANRNGVSYAGDGSSSRWTKFSIIGADTYTNASTPGVVEVSPDVVKFNTGYNTVNGYVARWTGITAADGSFTVRSENVGAAGPGEPRKSYGMEGFVLKEQAAPPPTEVWVDDDWTSQADVDMFDPSLTWQYDAFSSLQDGVDAVAEGGTVNVRDGTYGVTGQTSECEYGFPTAILIKDLDNLTIQAAPGHEPVVKPVTAGEANIVSITIQNSNHLIIDNIDSDQTIAQFDNWHVCDSDDLTVRNSRFEGGEDGIDFNTDLTTALIENNEFVDINTGSGDEVLDFTDGSYSDVVIQDNFFENNYRHITINPPSGATASDFIIRRNFMDGTTSQEGVRFNDGGGPVSDTILENNVIMNSRQQGLYVKPPVADITVRHNTFFNNTEEEIRLREAAGDVVIKNNIIYANGTHAAISARAPFPPGPLPGEDYNLIFNDGPDTESGSASPITVFGPNTITGLDPLFVSTTPDSEDLHLQPSSPAIEAGTDLGVTDDIEKNVRPDPAGSNPDMGAYEVGPPAPRVAKQGVIDDLALPLKEMKCKGLSSLTLRYTGPGVTNYGDVPLSGGSQAGHFDDIYDLTQDDVVLSFTYDANGLVDDAGCHAWAELGVREVGYDDFNPTWMTGGAGVWLATDYEWSVDTFDPDPPGNPSLDLDDKLILQRGGGMGESCYDLPSPPPNPWANHRVWWDRDGVDPWQNDETANTGGIYNIVITLHATGATTGEAHMNINGLNQGFETDGNWNTVELTPAGMTFSGDMTQMQVFYGLYGYGATHSAAFNDITATQSGAMVEVIKGGVFGPQWVNTDEEFEILPEDGKDKLGANTEILVNGEVVKIHTSCSQPIEVDDEFGDFVVVDLVKILEPKRYKEVDKAIEHIEKSLDDKYWVDDNHLDAKDGNKVFDEEKKAVRELKHLMDKKDTPQYVKGVCQEVIDELTKADYMLARTAINEAIDAGGDVKEIAKAEEEMAKAQEELDRTKKDGTPDPHYDKAIEHYKKAWQHAQKAVK